MKNYYDFQYVCTYAKMPLLVPVLKKLATGFNWPQRLEENIK